MTNTRVVHDNQDQPDNLAGELPAQRDPATRAADLATDRYVADERTRRRESLDELLGRGRSGTHGASTNSA